MKKTFIIFLLIILNITTSHAKNDSNITIEEVNNFLNFWDKPFINIPSAMIKIRLAEYGFDLDDDKQVLNASNIKEIDENFIKYLTKRILSHGVDPIPRNSCEKISSDNGYVFNCNSSKKDLNAEDYSVLLYYQSIGLFPKNNYISQSYHDDTNIFSQNFAKRYYLDLEKKDFENKEKTKKRRQAKCLETEHTRHNLDVVGKMIYLDKKCTNKIVKITFNRSKKSEIKFPGDIFYGFAALESLIPKYINNKFYSKKNYRVLKKKYNQRINKFIANPTDEKILGKHLIAGIKLLRIYKPIRASIGVNDTMMFPFPSIYERYLLMGDMLNSRVADTKKNKKTTSS